MQAVVVGYPDSQSILPLTKYLVFKYMPGISFTFLNYEGQINGWSNFIANYMETLEDEKVIFALDDYLIGEPMDMEAFNKALMLPTPVKLCECSEEEQIEYPVTTQYTIWDRKELISILRQTTTPCDFEVNGSKIIGGETAVCKCLEYDVHSALSARWVGVRINNIKQEDLNEILNNRS